MKRGICIFLTILCIGCSPIIQPAFDSDQFQNVIDEIITEYELVGVSAAVSFPNREWSGASGLSHSNVAISTEMRFAIASITKNFVAALILKLEEAGMLSIDSTISHYLPSYENVADSITIKQLLSHQSGVADYTAAPNFIDVLFEDPEKTFLPEEIISFVGEPLFAPGEDISYSNSNFILLGMIIEGVTGQPFLEALTDYLLNPAWLVEFYMGDENIDGELVHQWAEGFGPGLTDISGTPRTSLYSAAWTAGAMWSTASELNLWMRRLFSGQILTDSSMAKMTSFSNFDRSGVPEFNGYGLGTMRILSTREWIGHTGDIFGFGSISVYSRQDDIAITVLFNQDTKEEIRLDAVNRLFAKAEKEL